MPVSALREYHSPLRRTTGRRCSPVSSVPRTSRTAGSCPPSPERTTAASKYAARTAARSRSWSSDWRVTSYDARASEADSPSAPNANTAVTRVRNPTTGSRGTLTRPSRLELVAEPADRQDVLGVRRVALDLAAQPAHVDVHQPLVAEDVVAPHPVEQLLARQHPPALVGQLAQQPELRTGQVHLLA